jgi:hypothetical protein
MTDRSFFIGIGLVFALAVADIVLRGGVDLLFLVRKVFDLMDYLIFWR